MAKFTQGRKIKYTPHDKERIFAADKPATNEARSPFEIDRARIIHSAAFRRLQGKTQVFTVGESDFFRTRLTHSLEVAQIGKGLALRLKADPDLIEAVCLMHDIGHPPFGHAGEIELKRLMKSFGGFEANAQNIRIIRKLESKSNKYKGLNLTRAVIDGQLKYKEIFDKDKQQKKFVYERDANLIDWASKEAREVVKGSKEYWKSFECEIMEWADDIAYAVHDLEDSIRAGFIDAYTFQNTNRINKIKNDLKKEFSRCKFDIDVICDSLFNDHFMKKYPDFQPFGSLSSPMEGKANRKILTSYLIGRYIKCTDRNERQEVTKDAISQRYLYTLDIPIEYQIEIAYIKKLSWEFVIQSPQVRLLEERAKHIVRCLFLKFMREKKVKYLLPDDWKEYLPDGSSPEQRARVVSDYVSGMTDDYAQKTYAKLFLPNQGSIYEVL